MYFNGDIHQSGVALQITNLSEPIFVVVGPQRAAKCSVGQCECGWIDAALCFAPGLSEMLNDQIYSAP